MSRTCAADHVGAVGHDAVLRVVHFLDVRDLEQHVSIVEPWAISPLPHATPSGLAGRSTHVGMSDRPKDSQVLFATDGVELVERADGTRELRLNDRALESLEAAFDAIVTAIWLSPHRGN